MNNPDTSPENGNLTPDLGPLQPGEINQSSVLATETFLAWRDEVMNASRFARARMLHREVWEDMRQECYFAFIDAVKTISHSSDSLKAYVQTAMRRRANKLFKETIREAGAVARNVQTKNREGLFLYSTGRGGYMDTRDASPANVPLKGQIVHGSNESESPDDKDFQALISVSREYFANRVAADEVPGLVRILLANASTLTEKKLIGAVTDWPIPHGDMHRIATAIGVSVSAAQKVWERFRQKIKDSIISNRMACREICQMVWESSRPHVSKFNSL